MVPLYVVQDAIASKSACFWTSKVELFPHVDKITRDQDSRHEGASPV